MRSLELITPNWPAPPSVRACVTTRNGRDGCSRGMYASFNLADHVGDDERRVADNRQRLTQQLNLPRAPHWLTQEHGATTARIDDASPIARADASVCFSVGHVCAVLTADCLPVFFCDKRGARVGVAHAGWRGLRAGVLESTVASLDCPPQDLLAWMGPAIGSRAFRVGDEVRDAFADDAAAFLPDGVGRWMGDLYGLASRRLEKLGVGWIGGGGFCTYHDARFYSYRRERITGRMASLIWLTARD